MNPDRELNAYLAGGEHARSEDPRIQAVRDLHQYDGTGYCGECNRIWPCYTRHIIDEEGDDQ